MKPIIEKIARSKGVDFSEEEDSWFNGHMMCPVKTYKVAYPLGYSMLELVGEFRRNTWQKANWLKDIHQTDIYLWNVTLKTISGFPPFEISKTSRFTRNILGKGKIDVKCSDNRLRSKILDSNKIQNTLGKNSENSSLIIIGENSLVKTHFNSHINHEQMIRNVLDIFEEIALLVTC